ncbi:hypothetical protein [Bacillus mycoides]|uniref:hypothetical protein n=1 Tax=Bacillus mycoides TaxID=1405 RepID=UPI002E21C17F|nr:hypothetical protein [Bacillus mycoides]
MNKLPKSMKNVVEKIKNIEIPNLFHEPSAAGVGSVEERKTLGSLFSVAKSETKSTGKDVRNINEIRKQNTENIEEFVKCNKKFEEVLDDYSLIYGEIVNSNKPWSWQDNFIGKLSGRQRRMIKERALELHPEIPQVEVEKIKGLKFEYADF